MISPEEHENWRRRIKSAEDSYRAAKMRVGESAIERLTLPDPDGSFAHLSALQEETLALRAYMDLLAEYSQLLSSGGGTNEP